MSHEPKYHISIENMTDYKSIVLKGLSMHYFWSESSGTCHIMTPILDQLSAHYKDKLFIYCINIDKNKEIAIDYGVSQIPTIFIYRDAQLLDSITGIISLSKLVSKIDLRLAC